MRAAALARHTDPATSHIAADSLGNVTSLEQLVLNQLKELKAPGATTFELAALLDLSVITVSPRMAPLRAKGLVRDSGFRARGPSGRFHTIWAAT